MSSNLAMGDELDEDVDLPHTQLVTCQDEKHPTGTDIFKESKPIDGESNWSKFLRMWKNNMCFSKSHVIENSDKLYRNRCIIEIMDSNTLTEDDALFLTGIFGEKSDIASVSVDKTSCDGFLARTLQKRWPTFAVVISYTVCRNFRRSMPKQASVVGGIVIATLLGSLLKEFAVQFVIYRAERRLRSSLNLTMSFLQHCSVFLRILKKSLSFIHEIEVIGRGFLLTVSGASLSSVEGSKLMKGLSPFPKLCRCDSLRITLLRSVHKMIQVFRVATTKLLEKCPLKDDVDSKSHYIAFIDVEEFGPLMMTSPDDESQLISVTDNLSISAINSLSHLCLLQMSEFLRRFALCFSEYKLKPFPIQDTFDIIFDVFSDVNRQLLQVTEDVKLGHEFHQKVNNVIESRSYKRKSTKWDFTNRGALTTALRSLSLHLQVALCRTEEFSAELEKHLIVDKFIENLSRLDDVKGSLYNRMDSIAKDLQDCQSCWDETLLRFMKTLPEHQTNEKPIESTKILSKVESSVPLLHKKVKTDIAPEDQIFEGCVDEDDQLSNFDEDDKELDFEFKKRSEEEMEASRRMFAELKTVLVSKSEEWKEREARVLGTRTSSSITTAATVTATGCNVQFKSIKDDRKTSNVIHQDCNISMNDDLNAGLSIAAMAAARSKIWNLNSEMETFQFDDCQSDCGDNGDL